jgi:enoyl-CoA hydratase/carnithine racemase
MEWETMKLEGEGPVRHLVLNRPQVRNAINQQFLLDLIDACEAIDALDGCRAVILRGAGAAFCSGADLKEGGEAPRTVTATMLRPRVAARALEMLANLMPITIAAVHGYAIGGGCSVASSCDFRIGAESAKVSIREIRLGFILSWRSLPALVHLVGPQHAKHMALFGEMHGAAELLDWGFFDRVVPDAELLAAAQAMAERVVAVPPIPVQLTKASINALVRALDPAVFHGDPAAYALSRRTEDARTAREAFFAGTTPEWKNE